MAKKGGYQIVVLETLTYAFALECLDCGKPLLIYDGTNKPYFTNKIAKYDDEIVIDDRIVINEENEVDVLGTTSETFSFIRLKGDEEVVLKLKTNRYIDMKLGYFNNSPLSDLYTLARKYNATLFECELIVDKLSEIILIGKYFEINTINEHFSINGIKPNATWSDYDNEMFTTISYEDY